MSVSVSCPCPCPCPCNIGKYSISWIIWACPCKHYYNFIMLLAYTSWAASLSHKACTTISGNLVQFGQTFSWIIHRLARFIHVGKISWHTLHLKNLILFGRQSFHKAAHTFFPAYPLEFSVQSSPLNIVLATLYTDLMVNSPFLLWSQTNLAHIYGLMRFYKLLQHSLFETCT